MRKIWILAILVIFLFSLSISAFAASDTYYLHDLDLKVSIPSDYTVITRGTPENSSAFSQLGMTKSELMAYFEANNVYLNAITDMYREEIVVVMSEIDMSNLTLYTDSELQEMVKSWEDLYHTVGLIISKYDFYQCGQAKFIKLYFEDTAQTVHGLQYCTVYNGKAIHFTMRSYEGGLSSRQETAIKTVVDSVQFNDVPSGTVSGEDAELFVYTDQESGVSFAVPENWEQIAFTEDPEYLDAKFVSTTEAGRAIVYGSTDLWSELPFFERILITRADINNSMYSLEDVAEMCKTSPEKVSTVYFDGVEYFRGESKSVVNTDGTVVSVTVTSLVCIDNGWMYMFQFNGTGGDKLYSDFVSLIKSVKYSAGSSASDNTPSESNDVYVIAGVVLLAVAVIIGVIVRRKKKAKKLEKLLDYGSPAPQPQAAAKQRVVCKNCGLVLPPDSVFCHMCGTKIGKQ